jgi:cytochrome c peroxidase
LHYYPLSVAEGVFFDPRLSNADEYPVATSASFGNVRNQPDLVTPKLAALHFYQLAIPAPPAPPGSFDPAAAGRGQDTFNGKAHCATCHVPPLFTEPGWNMHAASDIGIDDFQANRAPDKRYRTAPLKGLWAHQQGGFYHDGRFATLLDVVNHYDADAFSGLGLSDQEKSDLVEYLKSL